MRYRPLLPRLYSAPMTFGRRRLRSSAASQTWLTLKTKEFVEPLFSLEEALQVAQAHMERRCTTSPASALPSPTQSVQQWSEGTASSPSTASASPTSSRECFAQHWYRLPDDRSLSLTGQPLKLVPTLGYQDWANKNLSSSEPAPTSTKSTPQPPSDARSMQSPRTSDKLAKYRNWLVASLGVLALSLPWAALMAYFFPNLMPDAWSMVGAALILGLLLIGNR